MIATTALERLKEQVIGRTGHHYYADKDKLLYERSRERMKARGLTSFDAYVELLEQGDSEEWRRLEDAITIGETYFFRYPDHFTALREKVLPELIRQRADTRLLRIWSIGCSTGAEPYSLAIVLRELLGEAIGSWRIAIIGGDISEKALSAARSARFGEWALRTMNAEDRARYFDRDGSTWVLRREFRSMVRFERQNVLDLLSSTPPIAWSGFDLVLCRNVLIYFSPQLALDIVEALRGCLAHDGTLFLGHAEGTLTSGPYLQRGDAPPLPTEFAQAIRPVTSPHGTEPQGYVLPIVPPSMIHPPAAPRPAAPEIGDPLEEVQRLADAGAYEDAERLCFDHLKRQPTSARLHYYNAILLQVSEDPIGAESALRRAIYLDRSFVVAHHRLGMLMLSLGRLDDARRSLQSALRLADKISSTVPLPEGGGVLAGELSEAARAQLALLGVAA